MNPSSLGDNADPSTPPAVWDWQQGQPLAHSPIIESSTLVEATETEEPQTTPAPSSLDRTHFLKLISLTPASSLANTEVLNSEAASVVLVTEQPFESGTHIIELKHPAMFKNVKIAVVGFKADPIESMKNSITLEQNKSAILKLCVSQGMLQYISFEGVVKKTLNFKGSNVKIAISLSDIGNFVGMNPCLSNSNENLVVMSIINKNQEFQLRKIKEWSFIEDFSLAAYGDNIDNFLKNGIKLNNQQAFNITDYAYDPQLKIMAFKRNGHKHKFIESNNKITFVNEKNLTKICKNEGQEKSNLLDFFNANKDKILGVARSAPLQPIIDQLSLENIPIVKTQALSSATYLPYADALLIHNGTNKAQVIYERDRKRNFIVSPYIFETKDVHFYLEVEEFNALIKQTNWKELGESPFSDENTSKALQSMKESARRTTTHVFFTCPPLQLQRLVESSLHFFDKAHLAKEEVEQEKKEDPEPDHGSNYIADLFNEGNEPILTKQKTIVSETKTVPKTASSSLKTELARRSILKIEEALYLQSSKYRQSKNFFSRPHSSVFRLLTLFSANTDVNFEKLLDSGLYFDSNLEGSFRPYHDPNSHPCETKIGARIALIAQAKDLIKLRYGLSHSPAHTFENGLNSINLSSDGKFLLVLDKKSILKIYSFRFGLTKVFEQSLKTEASLVKLPTFDSFLTIAQNNYNYFSFEEAARFKTNVPEPTKKPTPPPKEQGLNEAMLSELYQMGFSIDNCKKALQEVNSESIDAAVNVLLTYNSNAPVPPSPPTSTSTSTLKPEWVCSACTFINEVSKGGSDPHLCQICSTPADPECYFEEVKVEPVIQAPKEAPQKVSNNFSLLNEKDAISKIDLFQAEKENLLNSFILTVFFTNSKNESKLLILRLAYNSKLIQQSLILDSKGLCQSSSWLGKTPLKRQREEKELGNLFKYDFFDQIHSIFPQLFDSSIFTLSSIRTFDVDRNIKVENIFVNPAKEINGRTQETTILILFNPTSLTKMIFTNKGKTYNVDDFDIAFEKFSPLESNFSFFSTNRSMFIYTNETVQKIDMTELTKSVIFTSENSKKIESLLQTAEDAFYMSLSDKSKVLYPKEEPSLKNEEPIKEKLNEKAVLYGSPASLLSAFKNSTPSSFQINNYSNFVLMEFQKDEKVLDVVEFSKPSSAIIEIQPNVEVATFRAELTYSIPSAHSFAVDLLSKTREYSESLLINCSNSFQQLPLITADFKGTRFSKNMHLSNVLFKDNEYFSTNNFCNVFLFESLLERTMIIKKIELKLNESFTKNGPVSDLLIFIFNDIGIFGELQKYRAISKSQWMSLLADNQLPEQLQPVLIIDSAKNPNLNLCIELDSEKIGKYVAILPVKKPESSDAKIFSFDYLGVEGDYLTFSQEQISKISLLKNAKSFESDFLISLGKTQVKPELKVVNYSEAGDELILNLFSETLFNANGEKILKIEFNPSGQNGTLLKLIPDFFISSDSFIIQLRDEMSKKSFTQINKILKDFYQNFDSPAKTQKISVEYIEEFLRLIIFLSDAYGKEFNESLISNIDISSFFINFVYSLPKDVNTQLLSVFFDKFSSLETMRKKTKESIVKILENPQKQFTNQKAQKIFWSFVSKLQTIEKESSSFFSKIAEFHFKTLQKIDSLYTQQQKILHIIEIGTIVNGFSFEEFEGASKSASNQSTAVGTPPQLFYTGFEISDHNSREYYIHFLENSKLNLITGFLSNLKMNEIFTVDVYIMTAPKTFTLIKSKTFDQSFCHQVLKSEKSDVSEHFGLGFWNSNIKAKLLKIVVKSNYIASFHYTNQTSIPKFTFSFFGNAIGEENKILGEAAYYASLLSELQLISAIKNSITQIQSTTLEKSAKSAVPEIKTEVAKTESDKSISQLKEAFTNISEIVNRLTLSEIANKSEATTKLAGVLKEYKKSALIAIESLNEIVQENFDFDNNISFWYQLNNEIFSSILANMDNKELIETYANINKVDLGFYIVYDLFVFFNQKSTKIQKVRHTLLESFSKEIHQKIFDKLIQSFLKESDSIFFSHFQTFVDRITSSDIQLDTWETYLDVINKILEDFDTKNDLSWKKFLIYSLVMGKKLDASKPNEPLDKNDKQNQNISNKIFKWVSFILEHDIISISPKFREILTKMIDKITLTLFSHHFLNEHADFLKQLIVGLHKRNMISLLDSPLEEQEKKHLTSINTSHKLSKEQISIFKTIVNQLTEITQSELQKANTEDSIRLIVFTLGHIKKILDIFSHLHKSDHDHKDKDPDHKDSSKFTLNTKFYDDLLTFLASQKAKNEKLLELAVDLIVDESISTENFKKLLNLLLSLSNDQQQIVLETLSQALSDLFLKNKKKETQTEIGTAMMEFISQLFSDEKQRKLLFECSPLVDLCIQSTFFVINFSGEVNPNTDICKVKLHPHVFIRLFVSSTKFLGSDFNYGGADNFTNFPRHLIPFAELLSNIFHILLKSQPSIHEILNDSQLNSQKSINSDFAGGIDSLTCWLMCNHNLGTADLKSPGGIFIKKIFTDSSAIFKNLFKNEEVSKLLVNSVCQHFKRLYSILLEKYETKSQGYMSLLLIENALSFFESILQEISQSQKLTQHFLKHNSGLELIFGSLNSAYGTKIKMQATQNAFLSKFASLKSPLKEEEQNNKALIFSAGNKVEFEKEMCSNNLKMTCDEKSVATSTVKDWQLNKTGKSNHIYSTAFPAGKKFIKLRFKLNSKMEMRWIRIGIIVYRTESYLIVGPPSYIRLNGFYEDEKGQTQKIYLGELAKVLDSGYTGVSTEVFALNLDKLDSSDVFKSIANLKEHHELTDFELVIGKPFVTVVDKISPVANKGNIMMNMSISFISAEGFPHSKVDIGLSFSSKIESTLYNFIQVFFNSESGGDYLDSYIDSLSKEQSDELFSMIENQLDPIMNNFNIMMSKFLMVMSQKNKKMSVSIFKFLKKNLEKNDIFYALIEKIFERTHSHAFFLEFFEFGSTKLNDSPPFGNKFLEVVCKYLVKLSQSIVNTPYKCFPVPITKNFYNVLLRKYTENPFNFNYERAIVLIIQLFANSKIFNEFDPKPYLSDELQPGQVATTQDMPAVAKSFLDLLIKKIDQKEYNFVHLIVYSATNYLEAEKAIKDLDLISIIINEIKNETKYKMEAHTALQNLIGFESFFEILIQKDFDNELFTLLQKKIDVESFAKEEDYVKTFLKSIYLMYFKTTERLNILEEKLFQMIKKFKHSKFFIEKILLSFFEFQQMKLVKFIQIQAKIDKPVFKEIEDSKNKNFPESISKIQSSFLAKDKLEILAEITKDMAEESTLALLSKGTWQKEVETSFETEDFSKILEEKLFTKQPILFICNCDNNGSQVSLVFFASNGFVKGNSPNKGHIVNTASSYISIIDSNTHYEYRIPSTCDKFFEYNGEDTNNKSIYFLYEGNEKIKLSLSENIMSTIDLYPLKPTNETSADYEFPYDLHVNNIDVFVLSSPEESSEQKSSSNYFYDQLQTPNSKANMINYAKSIFSETFVFELPEEVSVKGLEQCLKTAINLNEKQKLLKEFPEEIIVLGASKPVLVIESKDLDTFYNPRNSIFEIFISKGGMNYLITKIIDSNLIDLFKTNEVMVSWKNIMKSILKLESLDGFLSSMIQNKQFFSIIFEIFVVDTKSTRDWAQSELKITWLILQKLAAILSNSNSLEMRIKLLKLNVLEMILEKLAGLTGEIKRRYDDTPEDDKADKKEQADDKKEEKYTKEIKKRKGVGYEKEGTGKKWIVTDYLTKKKQRTDIIIDILKLFLLIFDRDYPDTEEVDTLKKTWYREICESCFLPMLEGAFKCSSLHEMAKDFELYEKYCDVLITISQRKELKSLLLPIPKVYKPPQLEAILDILLKQEENTTLFKRLSENEASKREKIDSIEFAEKILATIAKVKSVYLDYFAQLELKEEQISEEVLNKINDMPLNERYKLSLNDLRFGLCNMKKNEDYEHHYSSNLNSDQKSTSTSRSVRLAQEIADLTASLPSDSYNAIFVRSDENRLDLMKAMISGAEGTPYANGLFEYHIYLSAEYPNSPPKCNLETTGSGDIRFNPNLYSCGKVCLSLLGTWRGNASENWDPKISNLLQLYLSIQSVVMSEEVYFNEPGYEQESGTEEGENKNEAYSNIVRIGNIKHAMIGHIKKPPNGFADVVRRHFYIKRDVILKECATWVKMAEVRNASYSGLVMDHNHKYAQRFSENNKNYLSDLKGLIKDLETTLKGLVESTEISTIYASTKSKKAGKAQKEKAKSKASNQNEEKLNEKIDVTYDQDAKEVEFNADDSKVADRWSRYIGVLGMDAVKKQSKANVLVIGISSTGLEVSKNLVLSGLKRLELADWKTITKSELSLNFYAEEANIGTNRAIAILPKLRQLNFYVKVDAKEINDQTDWKFIEEFDTIVICDNYLPITRKAINTAETLKKKIIICESHGIFTRIFCDFGHEFIVNDRDGEEPSECFIKSIDYDNNRIILFEKSVYNLRPGDYVTLVEVKSKDDPKLKPLDKAVLKIKDFHKVTEIDMADNLKDYQLYDGNGKIREIKIPSKINFKRYSQIENGAIDSNLITYDFEKFDIPPIISECYTIKEKFEEENKRPFSQIKREEFVKYLSKDVKEDGKLPEQKKEEDSTSKVTPSQPVEAQKEIPDSKNTIPDQKETPEQKQNSLKNKKLKQMLLSSFGGIHSISAFIGGVAAQEVIKSITNKYVPINQSLFCDFEELLDEKLTNMNDNEFWELIGTLSTKLDSSKTFYLQTILGTQTFEKVKDAKLFMVGAGAIGCELLKNLSQMYFGSGKGRITLTDPDNIELSNLSRQFLFREKHISKPKALVAARVIESMNPDYTPGKLVAKLDKVCEETEEIFSNEFFKEQSVCLNALDNIRARIYMDQRCVRNSIPLLESGTLGPKCHLQVIVPFLTENYGQVQDAKEDNSIPICTLKMFPEETIHCMEWAKDKFDEFFTQNPKNLIRVLEELKKTNSLESIDFKIIKSAFKFLQNKPKDVDECVAQGRKWFQKFFYNKIKQLLHVYPLDFKTKEGKLFWSLPKRPPKPIEFDAKNPTHLGLIKACVKLLMKIWSMDEKQLESFNWEESIAKVKIEPFKPKESSAESIKKSVEKEANKEEKPEEEDLEEIKKKLDSQTKKTKDLLDFVSTTKALDLIPLIKEEIFEKDDDKNGHIDFITFFTNLRAHNYSLPDMEWISVKLKAGRIVPALATTTAAIAGLQTIEAVKILKKMELNKYKNVFMNTSVPILTMSEPGPVVKIPLTPSLKVSVWDIWNYDFSSKGMRTMGEFFTWVKTTYGITAKDLMKGSKPVFLSIINKYEEFEKKNLDDLLDLEPGQSVYATVICYLDDPKKPLEQVPSIKFTFKNE